MAARQFLMHVRLLMGSAAKQIGHAPGNPAKLVFHAGSGQPLQRGASARQPPQFSAGRPAVRCAEQTGAARVQHGLRRAIALVEGQRFNIRPHDAE